MSSSSKKSKSAPAITEASLTLSDQNLFLQRQLESLKLQLVKESNKATEAERNVKELRARLIEVQSAAAAEKSRSVDINADMTRQYKSMREELIKKIQSLEEEIGQFKDKLEIEKAEKLELERRKDAKIALKDAELAEQRAKMEEMAREFGQMLKQTLDKMAEKIEITNEWEAEQKEEPIVRTFEEFNLGMGK
jgi:hypothetical protein